MVRMFIWLAQPLITLCGSDCSRGGVVRICTWLAQSSRQFGHVRSLSLLGDANCHMARVKPSRHFVCVCRTALVVVLSRSLCDELVPSDMKTIFLFYGCFALVLVWKFVWDAHSKFLSEDLLRNYPRCPGMTFWYEVLM